MFKDLQMQETELASKDFFSFADEETGLESYWTWKPQVETWDTSPAGHTPHYGSPLEPVL